MVYLRSVIVCAGVLVWIRSITIMHPIGKGQVLGATGVVDTALSYYSNHVVASAVIYLHQYMDKITHCIGKVLGTACNGVALDDGFVM